MEKDILEHIYSRYTKQVYLYLYSLCHNHAHAEDLMQETFLRAFCSLEIADEHILPWLLKVARNLYIDSWRKEQRQVDADVEGGTVQEELLSQMIKKEQNRRLYQAVFRLKKLEREIVVLYYFSGLSQEEISRQLGISYGNMRVILFRTKRKLKEMLEEK